MRARGLPTLQLAALLAAIGLVFVLVLQARSMIWRSRAEVAQKAVRDFAAAVARHREREGYLPGDVNRNGEIDANEATYVAAHLARAGLIRTGSTEVAVSVAGTTVNLRLISTRASAVPGFAGDVRNVIELRGLPCQVAEELDARSDDGNLTTGDVRASVASCAVGGPNDRRPVVAVALRP